HCDPYRVGQPLANWPTGMSAAAAPGPTSPGRSRPAACRHRTAAPVVSAIGEAAIALQHRPGYLQAPDRSGHPLRWRRIIAGQSSTLKAGTAGPLADFWPLAAARALMCGAEGHLSCDMAPEHRPCLRLRAVMCPGAGDA